MVIKTFNVEENTYKKYLTFCKDHGMSMSKQIQLFMQSMVEKNPKIRQSYLKRLEEIRKQSTIYVGNLDDFKKRY